MLQHDIREFIEQELTGRSLSGSLQSRNNSEFGQFLILTLYGTRDVHNYFQTEILESFEEKKYWIWIKLETQIIDKIPLYTFNISK